MRLNAGVKSTNVSQFRTKQLSRSRIDYAQKEYNKEIDYSKSIPDETKVSTPGNVNNQNSTTTTTAPDNTDESQTTVVASLESDNYSGVETHTVVKSNWNLEDLREYYNKINESQKKSNNTLTLDAAESILTSVLENLTEEQKEYYSAYKENNLFSNGYDNTDGSILGIDGSEEFDGIEDYGAAVAEKYQEIMPIISLEEDIENLKYEQEMSYYIGLVDSEEFKDFYNQDATNQALELFIYQNCFNFNELLNSPDYMNGIIFMFKDNVQYQYDDFASLREKLSQLNQTNLQVYFYLLKNNSLESANEYLNSVNPNVNYEKEQPANYVAKYSKEFEKFIGTFHSVGLNIDKEYIDYFNSIFQEIDTLYIYEEPVNLQYDFLNQIYKCREFFTKGHACNAYQYSDEYVADIIKGLYPEYYKNYTETKEMKTTLDYVIDNCKSAILEQYPYEILEQSNNYKEFYEDIKSNSESEIAKLYNEFNFRFNNSAYTVNDYYITDLLSKFDNSNSLFLNTNSNFVEALTTNAFYFTEEEKKNLFYLIANQGQDAAYNYFLTIHDDINSREGYKDAMDWMKEYNSKETWYEKDLFINGSGILDGINNYAESLLMLFSKNEVPTILEYKEMYIFNELLKDSDFKAHLYEFSQQVGEIGTQVTIDLALLKLSTIVEAKTVVKAFDGVVSGAANAGEAKHSLEMAGVSDVEVGIYTISTLASSEVFSKISKRTFKSLVTPNASEGIRSVLNNKFIFDQLTAMTASYANSNFKTIFKSCITNHKIDLKTILSSFSDNASTALVDGLVYASLDYATKRGDINTKFPINISGLTYEIDIAQLIKNLSKRTSVLKPSSLGDIETDYSEFEALYKACPALIKANPEHIFDDYLEKMESVSDGEDLYEEVEDEVEEIVEEELKDEDEPCGSSVIK